MTEQPNKPTLELPWEITALRWVGAIAFTIASIGLLLCFVLGIFGSNDSAKPMEVLVLFLIGFVGLLCRAVAGIWAALERMAPPAAPAGRSLLRRILGVD